MSISLNCTIRVDLKKMTSHEFRSYVKIMSTAGLRASTVKMDYSIATWWNKINPCLSIKLFKYIGSTNNISSNHRGSTSFYTLLEFDCGL